MSSKKKKRKKKQVVTKASAKAVVKNTAKKKPGIKINEDLLFILGLIAILALTYFARLNFIDIALERDEGDYALAGKLILEGATPYIDVFEQKPPGLFYSYALIEAIFGSTPKNLHMGFIVINLLTCVFIANGLRFLIGTLAGLGAAAAFALLTLNPYASGFSIQAEHLLVFYVSISFFLLAYYYRSGRLLSLILAGASVAWATTIKQNGLFFVLAIGLGIAAIHLTKDKFDLKKIGKEYAYYALGGITMAFLVMMLIAVQGVWKETIFWSITFPREFYISTISWDEGMAFLKGYYKRMSSFNSLLWYCSLAGFLLFMSSRVKWSLKVWIILILLLSFASIWPGLRFYGHYWLQFFFGVSIGLGLLSFGLQDLVARWRRKNLGILAGAALLVAIVSYAVSKKYAFYTKPNLVAIIDQIYGDNPFNEMRVISEFIKSKNPDPKTDKLLVAGSEPQLLLETGLSSPTPHTFLAFVAGEHPASEVWKTDYMAMMQRNEAKYAVYVAHPFSWVAKGQSGINFASQVYRHLTRNYNIIGVADIISKDQTIYKWDNEAPTYQPQSQKYVLVFERRN